MLVAFLLVVQLIMTKRIKKDHKKFLDIVSNKLNQGTKKLVDTGRIFRMRGKDGDIAINLPRIITPRFVHGESDKEGIGSGQGNKGDVVGRKPGKGKAGQESVDGINVVVDLEFVLRFLQDELELPNLQPRDLNVFEDIKYRYNSISIVGPDSLRHVRATMKQAMKRLAATNQLDQLHPITGMKDQMRLIIPEKRDFRYRQYKEIKIPSSNALICFARDCSGSMDDNKCEIVSDISWWIDCWIKRFYERVETCYFVHDSIALEVNDDKFYKYRHGGGTVCSTALDLITKQFENRFPPKNWNIYVFYFGDGENWDIADNNKFCKILKDKFGPIVNLFGMVQVLSDNYETSLKKHVDVSIKSGSLDSEYFRTASVGDGNYAYNGTLVERDEAVKSAIKAILGKGKTK